MNAFNRVFVALLAIGWCAALGATLLLVWDTQRVVDITNSVMNLQFDVTLANESDRILATIGIGALMALGVFLFAMQLVPRRSYSQRASRDEARLNEMQHRMEALQHKIDNERVIDRKEVTREVPVHNASTVKEHESVVREDRRARRWRFLPGR